MCIQIRIESRKIVCLLVRSFAPTIRFIFSDNASMGRKVCNYMTLVVLLTFDTP